MSVCGCGSPTVGQGGTDTPYLAAGGLRGSSPRSLGDPEATIWACDATAWTVFTPEVLNFDVGSNGLAKGRYLSSNCVAAGADGVVDVELMFRFGTNLTVNATPWRISTPPNIANKIGFPELSTSDLLQYHQVVGQWTVLQNASQLWYKGHVFLQNVSTDYEIRMRYTDDIGGTNNEVQEGTPINFAQFDQLSLIARFEIATSE